MLLIDVTKLIEKFMFALDSGWGYIWGTAVVIWTAACQNDLVKSFVSKYGANWQSSEAAKKDDKYLGALRGSKWIGKTVTDCSGLFKWAFQQLGGSIAHGSNSIFDKYCSTKGKLKNGKRTDGKALKPGTAVFTGDDRHPHIGLYIGNGWVIEAQGTINGVIRSKITLSKWTWWGELKNVNYNADETAGTEKPSQTKDEEGLPTLRRGDKGSYVTMLQTALLQRGYNLGSYGADGDFGKMTEAAVKQFQTDWGLTSDGVVGKQTWEKLQSTPINRMVTVHIPNMTQAQAEGLLKKYAGSYITEQ